MNEIMQSLFIATTGLTIAFAIGNRTAQASTFQFSQAGWQLDNLIGPPTGGILNGVFSGRDVRGENSEEPDGIISFAQGEVSSFEMSFQGDSAIDNFEHSLTELDLFRLEYPLANPELLEIFSSNVPRGGFTTYNGQEKLIQQQGQPDITIVTDESPMVREVSEPTSLIGLTLFGLGVCLKSKRRLGKD